MASNLFELVGEISVKGVQTAQRRISGVTEAAAGMADQVGRAGDRMSAFGDKASAAGDSLSRFSAGVVGVTGAAGAYINTVTRSASETLAFSKRLGVNAEALQLWQETAERFQVDQGALRDGFKELQLRADEFAKTAKGPAAEAFKRLGLSQSEINQAKDDALGLFNLVRNRLSGIESQAARTRIADELLGGQAGEQLVELLGASRAEIEKIQQAVKESGTILDEDELSKARKFQRVFSNFKDQLSAAGKRIAIDLLPALNKALPVIANKLVPALKSVGQTIMSVVDAFRALPSPVQSALGKLALFAVVLGPILSIGGRVVSMIGSIMSAARLLIPVFTALASGAIAPFLVVAAKVAAIVAAIIAAFIAVRAIIKGLIAIWPQLAAAAKATWQAILAGVKALWQGIKAGFKAGIAAVKAAFQLWLKGIKLIWEGIKAAFKAGVTALKAVLQTLVAGFKATWQALKAVLTTLKQGFKETLLLVKQGWLTFWNALKRVLNLIKQGILTAFNAVKQTIMAAWNAIKSILNSMKQGFLAAFEFIKQQTIGRVKAMVDTVVGIVKDMWQALTGNSIIPRMVDEADREFERMAKKAEDAGKRTKKGLEGAVGRANVGSLGDVAGAQGGGGGLAGAGGTTVNNIDMSRATFRDDRDVMDRLKRKGSDLTGAFA